jgi:hypothetical protein
LLAFRAFPFDKVINRRVRYIWHTAGIAFMIVGLVAVFEYTNDRNKANLWSIHSWIGLITITLYLAQVIENRLNSFSFSHFWMLYHHPSRAFSLSLSPLFLNDFNTLRILIDYYYLLHVLNYYSYLYARSISLEVTCSFTRERMWT